MGEKVRGSLTCSSRVGSHSLHLGRSWQFLPMFCNIAATLALFVGAEGALPVRCTSRQIGTGCTSKGNSVSAYRCTASLARGILTSAASSEGWLATALHLCRHNSGVCSASSGAPEGNRARRDTSQPARADSGRKMGMRAAKIDRRADLSVRRSREEQCLGCRSMHGLPGPLRITAPTGDAGRAD